MNNKRVNIRLYMGCSRVKRIKIAVSIVHWYVLVSIILLVYWCTLGDTNGCPCTVTVNQSVAHTNRICPMANAKPMPA